MTCADLDDCVRSLLEVQLDSFEKLEIVCALQACGQAMSQPDLEAACLLPSEVVRETLLELERLALIEIHGEQQVRLGDRSHQLGVTTLTRCYAENRAGVLSALSAAAIQRVRHMAAKAFTDALASKKRGTDD